MKHIIYTVFIFLLAISAHAQAPNAFNYQGVARNGAGSPLSTASIGLRISIHDGSATGPTVYQERHVPMTNAFGLFNVFVGGGVVLSGAFNTINWSSGAKYLQVELDPSGGTSYTLAGNSQLLSVPYALYAANGTGISSITAGAGLLGGTITTSGTISMPNVGTAGTYGSATQVPVITTDAQGRVTGVVNTSIASGGVGTVTSISTSTPLTGGPITSSGTIGLATSGVTVGTFGTTTQVPQITVDAYGRITSASNIAIALPATVTMGGDVTGASSSSTVAKLQGNPVSSAVPTSGQVLQWSGSAWTPASAGGSGWSLTGNSGTIAGTNFVGTTDNVALRFKVNNLWAGDINPSTGNVSVGVNAGQAATTGFSNVAIGRGALYSNNSGKNLVAIGDSALYNINGGFGFNTAVGSKALFFNSTGAYNTANGFNSLYSNTTAYANTAIGANSLYSNTTGTYNTAIGNATLFTNTTGSYNIAIGNGALYSNTTALALIAIGDDALRANTTGASNIGVGNQALYSNTTGSNNTAFGYTALHSNTTGSNNNAIGRYSLYTNVNGSNNTATGESALYYNSGGGYNTANGFNALKNNTGDWNNGFGANSLYSNTTGYDNTAAGLSSLYYNTTGGANAAVGNYAMQNNTTGSQNVAAGVFALSNNTTGSNNTAHGRSALTTNTTGSNNTAIGTFADASANNFSNATAMGFGAMVNANNKVRIGNGAVTVIEGNTAFTPSDGRFKKNIANSVKGLEFIEKLRPVTYNFEARKFDAFLMKNKPDSVQQKILNCLNYSASESITHSGFIAQEVEAASIECGYSFSGLHVPNNGDDNYSLAYAEFTIPLVKAVQELYTKIQEQQKSIERQEQKIADLQRKVEELTTGRK